MHVNRRRFLTLSKRPQEGPWPAFCRRVQRALEAPLSDEQERDGYHSARIPLHHLGDLPSLRQLCQEYDVALVLDGTATEKSMIGRSCLIVESGQGLSGTEAIGDHACLALPGTTVAQMQALGYEQFSHVPPGLTLAQWLAMPQWHDCRPGCTASSGLERVHALFADGQTAVLGGFGVNDESPLRLPVLQKKIPLLFELLSDTDILRCLALPRWPLAYRLDALRPRLGDINLAQLFLGHGGTLIWCQELVIRRMPGNAIVTDLMLTEADQDWVAGVHNHIEGNIKAMFDPAGLFVYPDELSFAADNL
ncbi:hypothetical protein [Advenella kashmirensis]|uniref:hypothetical protein n=1 Tax=Advenella kashmirensis TaxID=310575 RepID=UPI00055636F9|nr:hypothetical protein [Advenella kashmirensis]